MELTLARLLDGTSRHSRDDGIRLDARLEPLGGPGGTVKPAIYSGAVYQADRRWPPFGELHHGSDEPLEVFTIDSVPSQANRCERALCRSRPSTGVPEMILDLSGLPELAPYHQQRLSSWQFPHRNADSYLRGSTLDGTDFGKHPLGGSILGATHDKAHALVSWWPQALLYGFWQPHASKQRSRARHARAWVSEMVGWQPTAQDTRDTRDARATQDAGASRTTRDTRDTRAVRAVRAETPRGDRRHDDHQPAAVSFSRVTQRATVSFAQLRRVGLGPGFDDEADTAARALLVALGLHAHTLAFGQGFSLRSGADLRVSESSMMWLGPADEHLDPLDGTASAELLQRAKQHAGSVGVPLDGWDRAPLVLAPRDCLLEAIERAIESSRPFIEGD